MDLKGTPLSEEDTGKGTEHFPVSSILKNDKITEIEKRLGDWEGEGFRHRGSRREFLCGDGIIFFILIVVEMVWT